MVNKCIECDNCYCINHMAEMCSECDRRCLCNTCSDKIKIKKLTSTLGLQHPCDDLSMDEILCHKCGDELLNSVF